MKRCVSEDLRRVVSRFDGNMLFGTDCKCTDTQKAGKFGQLSQPGPSKPRLKKRLASSQTGSQAHKRSREVTESEFERENDLERESDTVWTEPDLEGYM